MDGAGQPLRPPLRRILRLLGWNALILLVGIVLAAAGAEACLRITDPRPPFGETRLPVRLVPGVGITRPPHAEVLHARRARFRQLSRANSLGFVDREPPHPRRAAESCHVTLIGDSFVEALEVPVADKVQVRLEELASRNLPALDVTTSAFGHRATAQINQLAFYDAFARGLSPDVVVLVVVRNDFQDNSLALMSWWRGFHPDYPPWFYARPGPDGEMEFVPPAPSLEELQAARVFWKGEGASDVETAIRARSRLADWIWRTLERRVTAAEAEKNLRARAQWLSRHHFPTFMHGWSASRGEWELLLEENPPPVFREALTTTAFALGQFRERAERDGAALVILTTHPLGGKGNPWFDLLHEAVTAAGGGIPIISQHDHIIARGGAIADAYYPDDGHWNVVGHYWAAEAILDWLKRNPEVCD